MAYGNTGNSNYGNGNKSGGFQKPAAGAAAVEQKKTFEKDPNEVGIGYEKEMKSGGTYIAITVQQDIPAGTKIAIFSNDKVKNRTEKTPTHVAKLSTVKKQA